MKRRLEFLGVPNSILVEPTNYCNLRCPMCPTTQSMKRKRGFMSFDNFKLLVENLVKHNLRPRLRFNFAGEPMLHKQIAEFINLAHRYQFRTDIGSNGTIYRKFHRPPTKMTFAIDGATAEAHEAYRIGSNFERTCENIKRIVSENIGTQFCVQSLMTKYSEGQEHEVIELVKSLGISRVKMKNIHTGHGLVKNQLEDIQPLNLDNRRHYRKRLLCLTPIRHTLIFWDSSLGICCVDYDKAAKSEPIDMSEFVETVQSPYIKYIRTRAILKLYRLCRSCQMSGAKGMSKDIYI